MLRISEKRGILCGLVLLLTGTVTGDDGLDTDAFCHDWFGKEAHSSRLILADTNIVVSAITLEGQPSGWIFRTDQMPPACKGKRDQIAVLVAIGTDARIKGLTVLSHKEDPKYFRRLKTSFFSQFRERRADDAVADIDVVTHATLSSRAIIRDVMEGAKTVISLPEVAAQLTSTNKGG